MTHVPSSIRLSPSRITWIGLSATLIIAAAVGIAGTSLVLHYLQGRLIAHGMEHNREFARAVTDRARRLLETPGDAPETPERVGGLLDAYRGLG